VKKLTVEVEEQLLVEARILALRSGLTMREVVERLLRAYVAGKVKVRGPEDGDEG
jgi:hypothetical protein